MNNADLFQVLWLQAGCLFIMIVSFAAWFRYRKIRSAELTCILAASFCAALLAASSILIGEIPCLGGIALLPGLSVYLWFLSLWLHRRTQAEIRQWGRRHGYRGTTIEPLYPSSRSGSQGGPDYRILARRVSDGQILIGGIFGGGPNFQVSWNQVPLHHLGHGPPSAGASPLPSPPVQEASRNSSPPILPHDAPPPPSKE